MKNYNIVFVLIVLLSACNQNKVKMSDKAPSLPESQSATAQLASYPTPPEFGQYWYQGKAEISTYDVEQERYGEKRVAEQVNIFVTEDFSKQKQVKLDDAASAGADRIPVLKLNSIRRFKTGIYDYSIMQSVFTPVEMGNALKSTCSIQDWCGHVFFQSNLLPNGAYVVKGFSYFESESDSKVNIGGAVLEDDLWVKIRLGPEKIKQGDVVLLPSSTYVRLRHKPVQAESAVLKIEEKKDYSILYVEYKNIPRKLKIEYETASPYRILGWEESYNGSLQSKGMLKKSLLSPYWSQNSNAFSGMRDSLKLNF